jgi:hypothetical protein
MLRTLLTWLLVIPPLPCQDNPQLPIEQIAKLARERTKQVTETFDEESFRPNTVFRGKTLLQWTEALRDADSEGTAKPAREVWLAMGPKAVPFLVAAQAVLDWEEVESRFTPRRVCRDMGDKAIEPLVRLLGSEHAVYAWVALGDIIKDSPGDRLGWSSDGGADGNGELRRVTLTKEQQKKVDAQVGRITKALEPCLGSADAATRLAGLQLLHQVATTKNLSPQAWGVIPHGARRLLDKDPWNEVRGAACELLVWLGLMGVQDGLTHSQLKKMAHPNGDAGEVDLTLPREVAQAVVMGILLHMQREMEKPGAPAGK